MRRAWISLLMVFAVVVAAASGITADAKSITPTAGGTLTWYTDSVQQEVQPLINAFQKADHIKINLFASTAAGVTSRIASEESSGVHDGDVATFSGIPNILQLEQARDVQKLPKSVTAALPKEPAAFQGDGYWFATTASLVGIAYNTKMVPKNEVPTSFKSFLKPYWKGKFSIPISTNSTSVQSYYQMSLDPNLGKSFLTKLGNNSPVIIQESGQQVSNLITGNQTAAITNDNAVWDQIIAGAPLKFIYPNGGLAAIHDQNVLLKDAPHRTAAIKFLKFLTTKPALKALASQGFTLTIPGVKLDPASRPTVDKVKFFPPVDPKKLVAAQPTMAPFLAKAFHENS